MLNDIMSTIQAAVWLPLILIIIQFKLRETWRLRLNGVNIRHFVDKLSGDSLSPFVFVIVFKENLFLIFDFPLCPQCLRPYLYFPCSPEVLQVPAPPSCQGPQPALLTPSVPPCLADSKSWWRNRSPGWPPATNIFHIEVRPEDRQHHTDRPVSWSRRSARPRDC